MRGRPFVPATPSAYLYVADDGGTLNYGGVTVYDPGLRRAVRSIARGVFNPMSIAVGGDATLYVLNESSGYAGGIRVTEYDAGVISRRAGSITFTGASC